MFDESEFLDVARHLQHSNPSEGYQRSAISRSYYAAFLTARRVFREQGTISAGGSASDHHKIAELLHQDNRALAENYGVLRRLRNEADYSPTSGDPDALAATALLAIQLAEEIRSGLERPTEHVRHTDAE